MSDVDASISCSVRAFEWTNRVWPPDINNDRKGKAGSEGTETSCDKAETSLGVKACACIWLTAINGTCQATASPLAVSSPTDRLDLIPGPRVTVTMSGFCFRTLSRPLRTMTASGVPLSSAVEAAGRLLRAFATRLATFCWWDSRAIRGWMPRYWLLSAVIFSWKCNTAAGTESRGTVSEALGRTVFFSRMATDVSSLLVFSLQAMYYSHDLTNHEDSTASVNNPLRGLTCSIPVKNEGEQLCPILRIYAGRSIRCQRGSVVNAG